MSLKLLIPTTHGHTVLYSIVQRTLSAFIYSFMFLTTQIEQKIPPPSN